MQCCEVQCHAVQCSAVSFTNEGETGHTDGPGQGDELTGEHRFLLLLFLYDLFNKMLKGLN